MATILEEIVAAKRVQVAASRKEVSRDTMRDRALSTRLPPPFIDRLLAAADDVAVIAEVKKASPSKGLIRPDFDPVGIAETYAEHGASALSVLTDAKYFQGSDAHLTSISRAVNLPLLRKDFTIDPYQVFEARAIGASAVLLIVSVLERVEIESMINLARELHMDALVEVHTEAEAKVAVDSGAVMVGINNRDLHTFTTDLATTEKVRKALPDDTIVVSESGINTRADVERVRDVGADAVLVGESLMREADIGAKLRELRGRA